MAEKYNITNGTFGEDNKYMLNGTLSQSGGKYYYTLSSSSKLPLLIEDDCWMNKDGQRVKLERFNSDSTMQDGYVTITKKMYFKVPQGEDPRKYNDLDVYSHRAFPQKYSRLPEDARYIFFGNCKISHPDDMHYFTAELEYSTRDPNATDENGNPVTSETKPWNLKPDNIHIGYTDETVLMESSYDDTIYVYNPTNQTKPKMDFDSSTPQFVGGSTVAVVNGETFIKAGAFKQSTVQSDDIEAKNPVQNTAGCKYQIERTVHNMEITFSYALQTQDWNINNGIFYGDSINGTEITVIGITIPKQSAIIFPMEANYIHVYKNDGRTIAYSYWDIHIRIIVDLSGTLLERQIVNYSDIAWFEQIVLAGNNAGTGEIKDDIIEYTSKRLYAINGCGAPEQICRVRPFVKQQATGSTTFTFTPTGNAIYIGWSQYLQYRQLIIDTTMKLKEENDNYTGDVIYMECEQLTQIPLTKEGYVDLETPIFGGTASPYVNRFKTFRTVDWTNLKLPTKGIDWPTPAIGYNL